MKQLIIKETETILNRAKEYYNDNNEVLKEKARNKYRELFKEETSIKREYGRNRYHNMSEKKRSLKEYQKNYHEAKKSQFINQYINKIDLIVYAIKSLSFLSSKLIEIKA